MSVLPGRSRMCIGKMTLSRGALRLGEDSTGASLSSVERPPYGHRPRGAQQYPSARHVMSIHPPDDTRTIGLEIWDWNPARRPWPLSCVSSARRRRCSSYTSPDRTRAAVRAYIHLGRVYTMRTQSATRALLLVLVRHVVWGAAMGEVAKDGDSCGRGRRETGDELAVNRGEECVRRGREDVLKSARAVARYARWLPPPSGAPACRAPIHPPSFSSAVGVLITHIVWGVNLPSRIRISLLLYATSTQKPGASGSSARVLEEEVGVPSREALGVEEEVREGMVGCGARRDDDPPRQLRRTAASRAGDTLRASCMYGHPWDDFERLERGHARVGSRYACTRPHGLTRRARRAPRPRPSLHEPRFICASPLPSVLVSYLKCYLTHAPRHAPPVHTPPSFRSATAADATTAIGASIVWHCLTTSLILPPESTSFTTARWKDCLDHTPLRADLFSPRSSALLGRTRCDGYCDIPRLSRDGCMGVHTVDVSHHARGLRTTPLVGHCHAALTRFVGLRCTRVGTLHFLPAPSLTFTARRAPTQYILLKHSPSAPLVRAAHPSIHAHGPSRGLLDRWDRGGHITM
ncbi:hypothetical protein B0H14DRAFT_3869800 [Mycena olivaceomarginata]|nr:hypothetical protein B0H14DRAFT_3869800 [Mycena olivaceomarginata]